MHRQWRTNLIISIWMNFVRFDSLRPSQQIMSVRGLPGLKRWLNQYQAGINVSCSRTQGSGAGEARTCNPLVSGQALYNWATALINLDERFHQWKVNKTTLSATSFTDIHISMMISNYWRFWLTPVTYLGFLHHQSISGTFGQHDASQHNTG